MGTFFHNAQGVRWLSYLEKRFPERPAQGLNLTLQVLDGILCHDGEVNEQKLKPIKRNGKTLDDHTKEYEFDIIRLFTTQPFTSKGDELIFSMLELTMESAARKWWCP